MGEKGLRALLAEATPGPWEVDSYADGDWTVQQDNDQIQALCVADMVHDVTDRPHENAVLIAAAVNALPALLDIAAAARGLVEIERPLLDADDVPHPSPLNRAVTALEAALGGLQDAG